MAKNACRVTSFHKAAKTKGDTAAALLLLWVAVEPLPSSETGGDTASRNKKITWNVYRTIVAAVEGPVTAMIAIKSFGVVTSRLFIVLSLD